MKRDYAWCVTIDVVQTRSNGRDIPAEHVTRSVFSVENDHTITLERVLRDILKDLEGK